MEGTLSDFNRIDQGSQDCDRVTERRRWQRRVRPGGPTQVKTSTLRPNIDPDFIGPPAPFTRKLVKDAFGQSDGDDVNY